MCGRFINTHKAGEIAELLDATDKADEVLVPNYNVAPSQPILAAIETKEHERQVRTMKWGLVPSWSKTPAGGAKMINARLETVATKPAFRTSFARRRCLIPADGFYEWQKTEDGKQPYFIRRPDSGVITFAGIFDIWSDAEDRKLVTCSILTTTAYDDMGKIHDRSPVLVPPVAWDAWLDRENTDPSEVTALLQPLAQGSLISYPVDKAVGNVRNNDPFLIEPVSP